MWRGREGVKEGEEKGRVEVPSYGDTVLWPVAPTD